MVYLIIKDFQPYVGEVIIVTGSLVKYMNDDGQGLYTPRLFDLYPGATAEV